MANATRKARKKAAKEAQAMGSKARNFYRTPKVGTPLEQRSIQPVFERNGEVHPSRRAHRRIEEQIKFRDIDKAQEAVGYVSEQPTQ